MPANLSPTLRRRRLGRELRTLREASRMSASAVAQAIGSNQTKVSAVEGARRKFTEAELGKVLTVVKAPPEKAEELRLLHQQSDQLGWWDEYSDVLPDNIELLVGLEEGASWVRQYSEAFVPALLQTQHYAAAIISSAAPYQRSADMPRLVGFRLERQKKLTDPNFRYTALVNEGALRRHVGGRDVMRDQLHSLLDGDYPSTVELHVLPFESGEHPAQGQTFALISFPEPEDPEIVFVDMASESGFLERQPEIRQHTSAFSVAMNKALDLDQSRQRITTIANQMTT
ncbi:MAG TPA: DUF5753 domain-containing protein [Pseudonocardiaceae bacterium]|jgi:transcriptional regulator with XRE-family HTH domain|nr:DUF5753 domain-containing protein [Pseudonocardiaceae bacterium]